MRLRYLLSLFGALVICSVVNSQEACNVGGQTGICLPAAQCEFITDYIRSRVRLTDTDRSFLRSLQCSRGRACCPRSLLPDRRSCGRFEDRRILGGRNATIYDHPWAALIRYDTDEGERFNCGGTLITNRYILTAAHCALPRNIDWRLKSVRLGETDITKNVECFRDKCAPPAIDVEIEDIIPHERYSRATRQNDIALLRLSRPVTFSEFLQPACLPMSQEELNTDYVGEDVEAVGWGKTENEDTSDIKLRVNLPVVQNSLCETRYSGQAIVTNAQLCAGGEDGRDTCSGDSGGAIFTFNSYGRWMAVGVVSYGPLVCGIKDFPALYTRVGNYMTWINSKLRL